ncbi:hypothetical protein [Nocardia sp. NPDC004604]|uniref:hypothetical protein n=1 Tax=Nocardia sp. NPDC004604 TaxID=3157013 RepID=UPI00339ED6F9
MSTGHTAAKVDAVAEVVAEAIGHRLENGEVLHIGTDICPGLQPVRTANRNALDG